MESEQNQMELKNDIENQNGTKLAELTIENIKIDAKQRKKIDKLVGEERQENFSNRCLRNNFFLLENILKKCGDSASSVEEKFYLIAEKLLEEQENTKKLQSTIKEMEKNAQNLIKQKDFAQNEYTKALLAKDKLENLCRELQKYNKTIKEENLMRIKDEEDKRKDITTKFQVKNKKNIKKNLLIF